MIEATVVAFLAEPEQTDCTLNEFSGIYRIKIFVAKRLLKELTCGRKRFMTDILP